MDTLFCMEEMCRVAFYPNVQDLCPKVYLEDARGGNRRVAKQNDLSSEMQETVQVLGVEIHLQVVPLPSTVQVPSESRHVRTSS